MSSRGGRSAVRQGAATEKGGPASRPDRPEGSVRSSLRQALIFWRSEAPLICTLRGLACSATGSFTVSTPAS